MRLLFIYFYKEFATFEKDSIVHLSKKYKFTLDNEKSSENQFYFKKKENIDFINDFYSENIDIGLLLGENGTGKSVLLNSIRDEKNDYSICIYEERDKFYILDNNLTKLRRHKLYGEFNIPYEEESDFFVRIDNKKIETERKFKSIYYSSIVEKINKNLKDDSNISDVEILSKIDGDSLDKKIELLEISDLHKMYKFNYNYAINPSKTFFKDAKEFIKDSYILLFQKVMELLNKNKEYEKIEKIFDKLPKFIMDDIVEYYLEEKEIFIEEIKENQKIVKEYLEVYKKNIYNYLRIGKIDVDEELLKINKRAVENENRLFNDDFFNELSKINFDLKRENIKVILESVRKLFKIKYRRYRTKDFEDNSKRMLMYFGIEKAFEMCLERLKSRDKKIDDIKNVFEIYKLYYLRQEMGYNSFILIDLFKKGKFEDILLLDKKNKSIQLSKDNKVIEDNKEKTLNEIKKIVEDNYSSFYNILIDKLEDVDDNILKLLIIKKVEKEKNTEKANYDKTDYNRASYVCLVSLLKSAFIEDEEKKYLLNILNEKEKFIEYNLLVIYNQKYKDNSPIDSNSELNFQKYKKFVKDGIQPFSFSFEPPISSGQKAKEVINARINDAIQQIIKENKDENILILLDEADLKLHLEWQRQFLYDLIEFLKTYSENKFYILYSTHSPMILSDITNDRVVFLKKEENAKFSEDKQDFTKSTFGANIYDIYADSFFVDDFMGKFAQDKITYIIERIESHGIDKQTITEEESKNLLKVVKNIGEPLLRNKLEDEIKSLFEIKDDIDEIVESLKSERFEEIKKELDKYTQDKQEKILAKLFGNQND
ncbi:hypothetical protein [Halarcobacter sp.]|uniref:hypothetical protein n=1 Tax=Halarcobacter sp. TaxID=2321133 RepID=UPI0029F51028|nr:hypothetical protein [Halarcobacter sp.]